MEKAIIIKKIASISGTVCVVCMVFDIFLKKYLYNFEDLPFYVGVTSMFVFFTLELYLYIKK